MLTFITWQFPTNLKQFTTVVVSIHSYIFLANIGIWNNMNRMWRLQWRHLYQWLWCWHQPGGAGSQAAPPPPPPLRPALLGSDLLCQDWHGGMQGCTWSRHVSEVWQRCLSWSSFQGHDVVILEDMLNHQWRPPILWVEWFRNFQFTDIKNLVLEVGSR